MNNISKGLRQNYYELEILSLHYPLRVTKQKHCQREKAIENIHAQIFAEQPLETIPAAEDTKPMLKEHVSRKNREKRNMKNMVEKLIKYLFKNKYKKVTERERQEKKERIVTKKLELSCG